LDQTIVAAIQTDILHRNLGVSWDDIVALDDAKRVLQEAAILPLILPEAFHGIREPWRAVLLYGPPGTGKTMLAKAVASQCQATFFNVSSSTLLSKYYGDSEKYVKVLFEMARATAPSVIFFDELDSLMSHRGSSAEHEASRRVKSELLRQMDGIHESESDKDKTVVILATTNKPWDLDEAVRRRLEKRVYIPLPSSVARAALFVKYLSSVVDEQLNWEDLAARTDGYSCADIRLICRDAAMMPMRRLVQGKSVDDIKHMREGQANMKISLTMEDVLEAIKNVQPSWSQKDLQLYQTWSAQYGSV
jgi:katanin p60 ATPase-containing subunit A1